MTNLYQNKILTGLTYILYLVSKNGNFNFITFQPRKSMG